MVRAARRPVVFAGSDSSARAPRTDSHARPKPARVVALSSALVLHVAAFALLIVPVTAPLEELPRLDRDAPMETTWVEEIKPIPLPPPPVPPLIEVREKPKPVPQPVATPVPEPLDTAPVFQDATMPTPVIDTPATEPVDAMPAVHSGPQDVGQLAVVHGPVPRYTAALARKRMEGTVILRILVGADGRPREIAVETSSGHRELDLHAKRSIEKWRFRPAMRDGVAVEAYGTLPVVFRLNEG